MSALLRHGRLSPSNLCPECSLILERAWKARILIPPGHEFWDTPIDETMTYPWHSTFALAQDSAAEGCHLCTLICRYCVRLNQIDDSSPLTLIFKHDYDFIRNDFAVAVDHKGKTTLQLNVRGSRDYVWEGRGATPAYGYFADHDIPSGLLAMLRDWSAECKDAHPQCHLPYHDAFPTRLVEIGNDEGTVPSLRLVNAASELRGQYATLSHCWGPNPDLNRLPRTTVQNLDTQYLSIPFQSLTPTFQDAVRVTRGLGLRHLWADSLCIIQNDKIDWEQESIKMADIYSNSFVTIAATGSRFGNEGLFLSRDELEVTPTIWRTPDRGKALALHPFLLRDYMDYENNPQPLYTRAWCMQELTLSRRVMHFLPGQVIMDCLTSTSYEFERFAADKGDSACMLQQLSIADLLSASQGRPLPPTAAFVDFKKTPSSANGTQQILSHLDNRSSITSRGGHMLVCFGHPQPAGKLLRNLRQVFNNVPKKRVVGANRGKMEKTIFDEWAALVENYSLKDITYSSDRLPAIWSFAQRMQGITRDEYLCGIWRSDIPRGLTFMHRSPTNQTVEEPGSLSPSWSWASHVGQLRYYGDGRLHKTKTEDMLARPVLLNFSSDAMSMGRSKRAALTLKCIAANFSGTRDLDSSHDLLRFGYVEMSLDTMKLVRAYAAKELLCLHMMDFCGLLVAPTGPDSGEYKRVGLAYVRHQDNKSFGQVKHAYMDLDWKEREIVLV